MNQPSRLSLRVFQILFTVILTLTIAVPAAVTSAQEDDQDTPADQPPPAEIVDSEGGAVNITGEVFYTNPFFTLGVAEPVVILEDQAGFVDRNEYFLMPVESQTLGQITSDFYTSPFSYSITLPIEPQGSYRDVDNDSEDDQGIQVFAVAYWNNTFGDPYLEERDLYGGGWSTAYASTRISTDPEKEREIVGGSFLVYAPDDEQGFPSGFGEDELLFTEDDPIVTIPAGYTVVNLDTDPFTFDRSRHQEIDLIEPESAALVDLSDMSYADAFAELVDILSKEYAFTEYKDIDWEALREEFMPEFERADEENSAAIYRRTLRDFVWRIPDGHLFGNAPISSQVFSQAVSNGLGIAIRELDDGRIIANFVLEDSPADDAGIELGTEIVSIDGVPIQEYVENTVAWSAPFSTDHYRWLQKLRYATRFPPGSVVELTFVDNDGIKVTVEMETVPEQDSFNFSSFSRDQTGLELPLEYELLDNGLVYAQIYSFSDNSLLTIQLWERMIRTLNEQAASGLIIDMRQNGGGRGFLADQMAAYFFDEPLVLGNTAFYEEERGEFYIDPRGEDRFYLPAEDLRYHGDVAVLVGPDCLSACEFFAYDMTLQDRAAIVGHYPTGGLGGSVDELLMPEQERFRYTIGRALNPDGDIHIEGKGVAPDVVVPVTEETLLSGEDAVLEAALEFLNEGAAVETTDGGELTVGESREGSLSAGIRVAYTLNLEEDESINIYLESDDFDTFLALYDAGESLLAYNDDLNENTLNAGIEDYTASENMTVVIEVSSLTDQEAGSYTITVEDAAQADSTEDDDEANAQSEETEDTEDVEDTDDLEEEGTDTDGEESTADAEQPSTSTDSILDTLQSAGDFESLLAAIEAANLADTLTGEGPFTLFAPNDAAFADLGDDTVSALLDDSETLSDILRYHVVAGEHLAEDILVRDELESLSGEVLTVTVDQDGIVRLDDARILDVDMAAANGVIHVIDQVLLLPEKAVP